MKILKTFEFNELRQVNRSLLEPYLEAVWRQRFANDIEVDPDKEQSARYQGILSFDGNKARAKNFIGVIQTSENQVEIYPKVFRQFDKNNNANTRLFIKHLFFWFDYCSTWKFPFTKNNLEQNLDYDLPELIINLMADRIKEVVSQSPISLYEEIEESLTMPRGRINFSRYISSRLSNGNHHILECDIEPLVYDNKLNRAIKYVTRLLYKKAKFDETCQKLNDIVFILDEVEDIPCTSAQLGAIKINSFYSDYDELIDICRLVLDQQIYNNQFYEQTQWCLLFPMEYVFEDFIAGFLEAEFKAKWQVEPQKSNKSLTDQGIFQMRHDIFLTNKKDTSVKIIVDTKYKLRSPDARKDPKRGISQSDLYQITSYAFRRGCKIVVLLYPNYSEDLLQDDYFSITSAFNSTDTIHVLAVEVPFWNMANFEKLKKKLMERLENVLRSSVEIHHSNAYSDL